MTKLIFGTFSVFLKAILGHFLSDFGDLTVFRKWDKKHDILHKINILYACILVVVGISFVLYTSI